MNFKQWILSEESIEQNFDKWIEDIKKNAGPKESEIISMKNWIDDKKIQFIKNALKKKKQENKQYLKYLIGFANTPQASFQEDYERAIDTIQWFITTNKMTKKQIEDQGWFNVGKQANELIKQKNQIVNTVSATQAKKERKAGKSGDLPIVAQSGNIKIYFSEKAVPENEKEELENSNLLTKHPAIVARHAFLCRYGRNTEWCTASPDGDYHADYADKDVYIVHINDKPEYQFMGCTYDNPCENEQFQDSNNEEAQTIPSELAKLIMDKLPDIAKSYEIVFYNANADKIKAIKTVDDILKIFNVKKIDELTEGDINIFIRCSPNKYEMAELIIKNKPELTDQSVFDLLHYTGDIGKFAHLKIAILIIKYKKDLSDDTIHYLMGMTPKKYQMAELIVKNRPELTDENVKYFFKNAPDKEKIAEILQEKEDNISKLSYESVIDLFHVYANDKDKIAQALNKYHTKKTPEIQELIDKYLTQTIAAK